MSFIFSKTKLLLIIWILYITPIFFARSETANFKHRLLKPHSLSLQYTNLENGYNTYQINMGAPPLFWGEDKKYFFNLVTSYSLTELVQKDETQYNFNKLSITPIFRKKMNSTWTFITVLPFSLAAQNGQNLFQSKALSLVGVATWKKKLSLSDTHYGFGFVIIKLAQKFLIVPNFTYTYVNPDYHWAFKASFPRISLDKIFNKFMLGTFAEINFDTFLLQNSNNLSINPNVTYINSEKTTFGLKLHFNLLHNFFNDIEAGYIIKEKLFLSDNEREKINNFSRKGFESYFVRFVLGYKF